MTPAQKKALEVLWPKYGLNHDQGKIDLTEAFGREAPRFLEIGFGMGASLAEMARAHPENDYIGIEVHRPGVGSLLKTLQHQGIENVRVICADAVEVLKNNIIDHSLDGIYLFFPDPWHKKRHHKRRIVQPDFISLLARTLKPDGILHMATDWEDYAYHMLKVMQSNQEFQNTNNKRGFSDRRQRPVTKFENRGLHLGHKVWDLVFTAT